MYGRVFCAPLLQYDLNACSVVSDGVEWFQLLSGGEDGVGGGGGV